MTIKIENMRSITIIFLSALLFLSFIKEPQSEIIQKDCTYKNLLLYGKVKFVQYKNEADITVQIVNSFPDIQVQFVCNHPDSCGEWQVVDTGEDLKIFITESFADLKIMPVSNFPGIRQ